MKKLDSTVLARRANQIKEELRQVLAACLYPDLVNSNTLPVDIRQRAQRLLGECAGGSETQHIKTMMVHNVKRVFEVLNSLPGFSCQPVEGGAFAFPRLHLPPKAIQKAKEMEMEPDLFYCMRLLEEAGVLVKPGMENGPKEGTHHIRFCIMTPEETMEEILSSMSSFHTQFMKDFS
ncbi:hypothetical protein NQZ68_001515 [Dissostichus eleginoides]|nr:hypothetical protein NQZ68_001515 [Dissostichus eleginoides]